MKLFGLALVLLCLISLFLLPTVVRAEDPPVLLDDRVYGVDWNERIAYNVTDTGTYVMDGMKNTIVCDHGGKYSNIIEWNTIVSFIGNNSENGWTFSNNVWSRQVFFTIGIVNSSGFVIIPESPPPSFIVYHVAHIPFDKDMIRLFNSRIGQSQYSSTFDFNEDDIINMRDIAMTIKNSVSSSP